jgi:hypothetical protein
MAKQRTFFGLQQPQTISLASLAQMHSGGSNAGGGAHYGATSAPTSTSPSRATAVSARRASPGQRPGASRGKKPSSTAMSYNGGTHVETQTPDKFFGRDKASAAGIQSGANSPGAVGHYDNAQNVNTAPRQGAGTRQRLRQGPSQVAGSTRGKKPTRVAG